MGPSLSLVHVPGRSRASSLFYFNCARSEAVTASKTVAVRAGQIALLSSAPPGLPTIYRVLGRSFRSFDEAGAPRREYLQSPRRSHGPAHRHGRCLSESFGRQPMQRAFIRFVVLAGALTVVARPLSAQTAPAGLDLAQILHRKSPARRRSFSTTIGRSQHSARRSCRARPPSAPTPYTGCSTA